jgi:tRNA A58 N-methylase Trm61
MISFLEYGYFVDTGWIRSYNSSPQNANGEPIAWLTYSFIYFIEDRLTKSMNILEFGSGNSTHYFSKRLKHVYSVEHHLEWYEKVKKELNDNCTLEFIELDNGYELAADRWSEDFDIILVDGRKRVECVKNSLSKLKENGVLILDNSEREEYKEAFKIMKESGFKRLDFFGIAPGYISLSCTTVFYRTNNCLNI